MTTSQDPSEQNELPTAAVFDRDLHRQQLDFQMTELPADRADRYEGIPPNSQAVLAELDMGQQDRFVILKSREPKQGKSPYTIAETYYVGQDEDGRNKFHIAAHVGIEPGVPVEVNRREMNGKILTHSQATMSGKHATLHLSESGVLSVVDHSTNGTHIRYAEAPKSDETAVAATETTPAAHERMDANLAALRNSEASEGLGAPLADAIPKLIEWIHDDSTGVTPEADRNWDVQVVPGAEGKNTLKATRVSIKHNLELGKDNAASIEKFEIDLDEKGSPIGDSIRVNMEFWSSDGVKDRRVSGVQLEVNGGELAVKNTDTLLDHKIIGTDQFVVKPIAASEYRAHSNLLYANRALALLAKQRS